MIGYRRGGPALAAVLALTISLSACNAPVSASPASQAAASSSTAAPPPCAPGGGTQPPPVTATTITTLEQAYFCIFANYFSGPVLDDRTLLAAAFAGFTQELERTGLDQPNATLPALTGDRQADWDAFSHLYQQVTAELPAKPGLQQAMAAATMQAMVGSLNDDHAHWDHVQPAPGMQPGDQYGIGITTLPPAVIAQTRPAEAVPPLFVTSVTPGSPAATQGVQPGDIINSVNDSAPFVNGIPSPGVVQLLNQKYPQRQAVHLSLRRPSTGRTMTVTVAPAVFAAPALAVSSKLLHGDVAYIEMPGFFMGGAQQVLQAIADLAKQAQLRGIVLDMRRNGGGGAEVAAQLLSALAHGKVWSYDCDVKGNCTPNTTSSSTPLVGLPLVELTGRACASACDAFTGAVKDLGLGKIVGTRTAGIVAGPASMFLLDDNSTLTIPALHELSANKEIIDGIGVAPDYYVPQTPADLSSGHDAGLDKALQLLGA